MNSASRRQRLVLVADSKRLRLLIQEALKMQFQGNASRAARAIGLSQPQLHRLANCEARQLRVTTLKSVARLFTDEQRQILTRCLMTPYTRATLRVYAAWLGIRVRSARDLLRVYRPKSWAEEQRGLALVSGQARRQMKVMIALRKRFRELFDRFDGSLIKQGHFAHRVGLAYHRIFCGLFEHDPSGTIERRWSDLSRRDLRAYLRAGITRERILLKRSPDLQRAQLIAPGDGSITGLHSHG